MGWPDTNQNGKNMRIRKCKHLCIHNLINFSAVVSELPQTKNALRAIGPKRAL